MQSVEHTPFWFVLVLLGFSVLLKNSTFTHPFTQNSKSKYAKSQFQSVLLFLCVTFNIYLLSSYVWGFVMLNLNSRLAKHFFFLYKLVVVVLVLRIST